MDDIRKLTLEDCRTGTPAWKEFVAAKKAEGILYSYADTYIYEQPIEYLDNLRRYVGDICDWSKSDDLDEFTRDHALKRIIEIMRKRPDLRAQLFSSNGRHIVVEVFNNSNSRLDDMDIFAKDFIKICKEEFTVKCLNLYFEELIRYAKNQIKWLEKGHNIHSTTEAFFNHNFAFTAKLLAARPDIVYRAADESLDFSMPNPLARGLRKMARSLEDVPNSALLLDTLNRISVKKSPEPHAHYTPDPKTLTFRTDFFIEKDLFGIDNGGNRLVFEVFQPVTKPPATEKERPAEKLSWLARIFTRLAPAAVQRREDDNDYEIISFSVAAVENPDGSYCIDPTVVNVETRFSRNIDTAVYTALAFGNERLSGACAENKIPVPLSHAFTTVLGNIIIPYKSIAIHDILDMPDVKKFLEDNALGITPDARPVFEVERARLPVNDRIQILPAAQIL